MRRLMEATARTEYGCEPDEASAIELVFNLPTVEGKRIDVLSNSDERFLMAGGSSSLIDAMTARLARRITTNRRATRLDPLGGGARVTFSNGQTVAASAVIVAVPVSVVGRIAFGVPLPDLWRRYNAEVALGKNGKIQAVTTARPWKYRSGAAARCGRPITRRGRRSAGTAGSGRRSAWAACGRGSPGAARCSPPTPPTHARWRSHSRGWRRAGSKAWPRRPARRCGGPTGRDPLSMGAYVNYRPGQLTKFADLIWTETDGVASRPLASGPAHFAGEYLSDAYPGYMNGGWRRRR